LWEHLNILNLELVLLRKFRNFVIELLTLFAKFTLFANLGPIEQKNIEVVCDSRRIFVTVPFTFSDSKVNYFLDLQESANRMISQV